VGTKLIPSFVQARSRLSQFQEEQNAWMGPHQAAKATHPFFRNIIEAMRK